MLVIPEGQFMGRTGYYDEDLEHVDVYKGIKLNVTGLDDSTSWLELRHFDDQGIQSKTTDFLIFTKILKMDFIT